MTSIITPSIVDQIQFSTKFKHTWITVDLAIESFRSGTLALSLIFAYDAPGILSWYLLLACLLWYQLDRQRKLIIYYLERNSNFLLRHVCLLCIPSVRGPLHPAYRTIRWCPMCRLLQISDSASFLLWIQATCKSCSIHLLLGCIYEIRNYEGSSQWPNFATEFVDPLENAGILIESDIIFVDKWNKIRYSCIFCLAAPINRRLRSHTWISTWDNNIPK